MKLIKALELVNSAASGLREFRIFLACGFTPLHLETFLAAEGRLASMQVSVLTGSYGDVVGNIEKLSASGADAGCVIVEYPDLDPRLGIRRCSGWTHKDYADVLRTVAASAERIIEATDRAAQVMPLCVLMPTLSILPFAHTPLSQTSSFEAQLALLGAQMSARLACSPQVRVVSQRRIDELSSAERFDMASELAAGFPYTVAHASAVAEVIGSVLFRCTPKKGIITDLDDTLWQGIVGEVGINGVSWDLEHGAQVHGMYQQLLHCFAQEGVLVGAASKNSPEMIDKVFECRSDLLLPGTDVFPVAAHWGRKSESVSEILRKWNIGDDDVLFVDDSPLELAEVKSVHPGVECIRFPRQNPEKYLEFWKTLRGYFGKPLIREEDAIRLRTIRDSSVFSEQLQANSPSPDEFLKDLRAELIFGLSVEPTDTRALELINKTNQFNLNGQRHTESSLRTALRAPGAFMLTTGYRDKFGPLGKIAVLQGQVAGSTVSIDSWVMSCRAFSRRIEFACLRQLFEQFRAETVTLAYVATNRNSPIREFLQVFKCDVTKPARISRDIFRECCPRLFHKIVIQQNEDHVAHLIEVSASS